MKLKIFFAAFLAVSFISCSTAKKAYIEEQIVDVESFEARYKTIDEDKRNFTLLQMILAEEKKNNIDEEYLVKRKNEVLKKIKADIDKSIKEKDFLNAVNSIESLKTAGIETDFELPDRKDLFYKYINNESDSENYVTALYQYLKYISSDIEKNKDDNENLVKYAEIAYKAKNRFVLRKITEQMKNNEIKIPENYIDFISKNEDPAELMKGTVTIWVNKGIKVDRGVGTPDRSIGSGFFIDKRGYIITNYHVIESEVNPEYEGYSRLYIKQPDYAGTKIPAKVVGWDPVFDVALLKTELKTDYIFSINNEDKYRPGENIYAIGSPGGLDNTITSGIISAEGRRFLPIGDSLQVDVPINPGNSGGPLVNSRGEMIGIVFAGIEQFEGINFAIPAHWVVDFLPDLFKGGEVTHSWFGISVFEKNNKLEILYTVPGEAASLAGLKKGDILKSINGVNSESIIQVQKQMMEFPPERMVKVIYERDGIENEAVIALGKRSNKSFDIAIKRDSMKNVILPLFGMDLESTGNYMFKEGYSVKKIYEGSAAAETGISVNDPLTIKAWKYDLKKRYALLTIYIKKRKAGFMESGVQLITSLDLNNLL